MPAKKKKPAEKVVETVSSKKVIYAEIDDEVTAIYDKLHAIGSKQIYIVVPERSILFQSVVNLKILKRKAEDDEKEVFLITNDKNGIHLAQKVGIIVYNKSEEDKTGIFSTETVDERLKITPLKASVNDVEDQTPTRLSERKLSISEILQKRKNKGVVDIKRVTSPQPAKEVKEKNRLVIVAPNRHALIALISLSLIVLLVVVYIALPGVTIYLTPTASVLEKSVNITLADAQKNRGELETHPSHVIASYPVTTKVSKTITHTATGKKFSEKGSNSSGKLTVVNLTSNAWPLIAKTRFQTSDGIVFRLPEAVTVPAASASGPGKLEVYVVADPVDANGAIVGELGNVGPTKFFLPGLKESSRNELYAESTKPMSGGVTDYIAFVSKEDIEAAKGRIENDLIKAANAKLQEAVNQKSDLTGDNKEYILLDGDKSIKVGEVKVTIDPSLEGKEIKEFSVSGELDVSGVYYDHEAMLEILKEELLLKKSPQKELLRINEESTSYRIFEWDEANGRIKLTANIKGVEQFVIDPEKENGARLLEKIKEHVAGLDIDSAKAYIQNLPEINKVEVESWPAWSPNIPKLSDNIDFDIRDNVKAD